MTELDVQIAKISALLNSAIRHKSAKAYKSALLMLEKCNPKPTMQQILEGQARDNQRYAEEQKSKQVKEGSVAGSKDENLNLEDMSVNQLEKELENLRQQDPEQDHRGKTKEELEEEEEKRIQEVIKRYEKTFGRIKDLGSYKSSAGSVTGKSIGSSRQSKGSKATELSTVSQREAFEKLKKLDEEEERIKREKDELMKFLEMRSSYSKGSSRPVTVSSIVSRVETGNNEKVVEVNKKEKAVEENKEVVKKSKPRKTDDVEELFKNL